jgi:hypothetical protein
MPAITSPRTAPTAGALRRALERLVSALAGAEARAFGTPLSRDPR